MANGVRVQVSGLDKLVKKLGAIPENVKTEVDAEMDAVSRSYVNRAAKAAPVDHGYLKNGITYDRIGMMQYEIVSAAKYSAYVEFGTITKVQVPAELVAYAAQFKGKGLKKNGGMRARPFFFPQLPIARSELNKNLKAIIAKVIK